MEGLQVFQSSEFGSVQVIEEDGKVLFGATEVAKALGYTNPHKAIADHCRYLTKREVPHPQNPEKIIRINFIPESDVYRLICSSKLESAQRFEQWVFEEVLPSIRKTGTYFLRPTISPEELALRQGELALGKAKFLADLIEQFKSCLSNASIESMVAYSANSVAGYEIVPLPRTEKHYTATQIGKMLGISRNLVGRVANLFGLKTEQNGQWVLDKADNCDKQVEVFRYNQAGVDAVREAYMRWQQDDEDED